MHQHLFNHIDIPPTQINILDGNAEDLNIECQRYEEKIKLLGGIRLFLSGIGGDGLLFFSFHSQLKQFIGHIAFNEPGSSLKSRTRVAVLSLSFTLLL